MKSNGVVRKESALMRLIKGPIRILARALDLYVQSLTGSHVSYGNAMGCPTPQLPRSLSSQSSFKSGDEELTDLVMLASRLGTKIEATLRRSKSSVPLGGGDGGMAAAPMPRSRTVGFERIDEERAFEFGDDHEGVGLLREVHPIGARIMVAR